MNEIIKSLYSRKSVRAYEDRPIPDEIKQAILRAATEAPTAGCQQLYTILDITDQALKDALVRTCDNQPFIAKAPMVLIFCADCKKWYDAYREAGCSPREPGIGDLMLAVTDTAIAAQNAVTAAESFGIGSCYIGDIMENCEQQRTLLNLPDYVFPAAMVVFGWPTRQQKERQKPRRCDLSHIVHENTYRSMDGGELREMFGYQASRSSFEEWMAAFCNRKYESNFSKEMTRSVAKYLEQYKTSVPKRPACFLTSAFNEGFTDDFREQFYRHWNGGQNFLYVASSFDSYEINERYGGEILEKFRAIGVELDPEFLDYRISPEEASSLIATADVIFLAGGNTQRQMGYFREYSLREAFAYVPDHAVIIGLSAGSLNMADRVVLARDVEDDTPELSIYEGLGLVSVNIEPHLDLERQEHLADIAEAAAISPIYGLFDNSFIVIQEGQMQIFGDYRLFTAEEK